MKLHESLKRLLILVCVALFFIASNAQENSPVELYKVKTLHGFVIEGSKVTEDEKTITILTTYGEVKLLRTQIKFIKKLENYSVKDGELWSENFQATRYFWQPNGFGLKKGEGYYQNIWVFFNQASYGITDRFSLSAGVIPAFLIDGGFEFTPVWLVPKFSLPIVENKLSVAVGALIGSIPGAFDDGFAGIGFGSITLGNPDGNFTVGFGLPFAEGETSRTTLITVNAMYRISKRNYLVAESVFFSGEGGLSVLGARSVWPNLALDYGLMIPLIENAEFVLPWIGFTVPF